MFYQFNDEVITIDVDEINHHYVTAGYATVNELEKIYERFGFSKSSFDACRKAGNHFLTGIETFDDYCFVQLRIANIENINGSDDFIALYIRKNLLIVVDAQDRDCSTINRFMALLSRYSPISITVEKLVDAFLESLVSDDNRVIEETGFEITKLEEFVLKDRATDDFNFKLLQMKKELLIMHNYYEQLIDIGEALEENENEIFSSDCLKYISNFTKRTTRLRDRVDALQGAVVHLQDAYSAYLDLKLNHTMKLFTVVTTMFFPLTLIVGWYGMNFSEMPELGWKYGYVYVIVLSVLVVAALAIIGKRRKWL